MPAATPEKRYRPFTSVIVVATGVPHWSLSVTSTLAIPGSPMSWLPSPSASSHTLSPTLALRTLGFTTMFVTDALTWIGSWTDVVDAVFVRDVTPLGSGSATVTSNVAVRLWPGRRA